MGNDTNGMEFQPRPTSARPLLGLTVLVVEDSHYSSEALRQMCLRSGARIRRADCVASAQRHLNVYSPSAAIVDLGLPDGSGLDLIQRMAAARQRVPILLGTSGDEPEEAARAVVAAGANGFLPKPVASLAAFQAEILRHMPEVLRPQGPRKIDMSEVVLDPLALREDLAHALDLLELEVPPVGYLRRFLIGLARVSGDGALERTARAMDGGFGGAERV
ncbi:response regulator, partial [Roseicyclus sp.]|uniref:response regulator n=1 Tax=Roseicyclus sp. TaxID=1914329 RepID=UPI003FA01F68